MIDDHKEIIAAWEKAFHYNNDHDHEDAAMDSANSLIAGAVHWLADAVGGRERAGELILLTIAYSDGFLEWVPWSLKDEIVRYVHDHDKEEGAVT